MKVKTSVTLNKEILKAIDSYVEDKGGRSAFVEEAVRAYLTSGMKRRRDQRDFEIINKRAAQLNKEAIDALSYQVKK